MSKEEATECRHQYPLSLHLMTDGLATVAHIYLKYTLLQISVPHLFEKVRLSNKYELHFPLCLKM